MSLPFQALSTLLPQAVSLKSLDGQDVETLTSFFSQILHEKHGAVGFAQGVLEDADDTARALLTLQYLGEDPDLSTMIKKFEHNSHFKTYDLEHNASVSVNCNVLLTLLTAKSIEKYTTPIENAVKFVLSEWQRGPISDKWNLSPHYPKMLLCGALVRLLERSNEGCLEHLSTDLVRRRIPLVLFQALSQTLSEQCKDGSWDNSSEVTAYCVLTIIQCLALPWSPRTRSDLETRLLLGRRYIATAMDEAEAPQYRWVEKVTYQTFLLKRVYCITALQMSYAELSWNQQIVDCFSQPGEAHKMRYLLSRLPLIRQSALDSVDLAITEASCFSKSLMEVRENVFPRREMPMTDDKYLEFIPVLWTISNHIGRGILSYDIIWNMMILSMLNYHVDEYMESVVIHLTEPSLKLLKVLLADECGIGKACKSDSTTRLDRLSSTEWLQADSVFSSPFTRSPKDCEDGIGQLEDVIAILSRYTKHVLQHTAVLQSPQSIQKELAFELYNFLLAHICHNEDNLQLRAERERLYGHGVELSSQRSTVRSYFKWVHSVAADDTSCPFSFRFFACLISKSGTSCFRGPQAHYLSHKLARSLASMCRQYNDYGSAVRDRDEGNLNSLDFPEFQLRSNREPPSGKINSGVNGQDSAHAHSETLSSFPTTAMKEELMRIADFERSYMQLALRQLGEVLQSPPTMDAVHVFVNVTDLSGQLYVEKDIASRIKTETS